MTGPDLATRQLVIDRDGRRCVRCHKPGQHIHHRKPRGMGGTSDPAINSPANLIYLCMVCHEYIEKHREEGYADGWLVRRNTDPATVAVLALSGLELTYRHDGSVERHPVPWIPRDERAPW